jgi:arabinose-5-phosphate isomerase
VSRKYLDIARSVLELEASSLELAKKNLNDSFESVIQKILNMKGRLVVTGMGKSGLVGKKISATLASTGTKSFFLHPAEAYHGDLGMISEYDIIIAISNSGETSEILKLLSFFKDNGNIVIAMTGNEKSTLVKFSDFLINTYVEKEACPLELAPTSSTTVTLALGDALSVALMEAREFKAENFARFHPGGSLGRKLLSKVCDFMQTENLPIVSKEATFEQVISAISSGRSGLCVVEFNGQYAVVTDGDVRRNIFEYKEKVLTLKASDMMNKDPKSVTSLTKLIDAEQMMQEHKIATLLVIDNNKCVGLISRYSI